MRRTGFASALAAIAIGGVGVGCTHYGIGTLAAPPVDLRAPPAGGFAEICVVRPHWAGFAVSTLVRDNGQLVGGTKADSYFCYLAEPGTHELVVSAGDDIDRELGTGDEERASVFAVGGQRYYLHHPAPNAFGLPALEWTDPGKAREMIDKCRFTYLESVPGSESLPGRLPVAHALRESQTPPPR